MKEFNTAGTCFPHKHYMVDITKRIDAISKMVENGDYFHAKKGYLVSFCFNKNKVSGSKTIQCGDKTVYEVVV